MQFEMKIASGSQRPSRLETAEAAQKTVFLKTNRDEGILVSGANLREGGTNHVEEGKGKWGKRRKDRRGKTKVPWSREERRVLWECYVRSGKRDSMGNIQRVKDSWDGM